MMYDIRELSPRGHVYLVLNIVTPVAAIIAVGLRIWIRVNISKSVGVEDLLLVASLVSKLSNFALSLADGDRFVTSVHRYRLL